MSAAARAALLTICEGVTPTTLASWPAAFTRRPDDARLEAMVGKSRVLELSDALEQEYPLTWNSTRRLWVAECSLRVRYELGVGVKRETAAAAMGADFRALVKAASNGTAWRPSLNQVSIGDRPASFIPVAGAGDVSPAVIMTIPIRYQFYA